MFEITVNKKSWAAMAFDEDFEEEKEWLKEEAQKIAKLTEERRNQLQKGMYELEDGEILE